MESFEISEIDYNILFENKYKYVQLIYHIYLYLCRNLLWNQCKYYWKREKQTFSWIYRSNTNNMHSQSNVSAWFLYLHCNNNLILFFIFIFSIRMILCLYHAATTPLFTISIFQGLSTKKNLLISLIRMRLCVCVVC